jgi:hypothetical protein
MAGRAFVTIADRGGWRRSWAKQRSCPFLGTRSKAEAHQPGSEFRQNLITLPASSWHGCERTAGPRGPLARRASRIGEASRGIHDPEDPDRTIYTFERDLVAASRGRCRGPPRGRKRTNTSRSPPDAEGAGPWRRGTSSPGAAVGLARPSSSRPPRLERSLPSRAFLPDAIGRVGPCHSFCPEGPAGSACRRGDPVLTLITCGGSFDSAAGRYTHNVVVTAILRT